MKPDNLLHARSTSTERFQCLADVCLTVANKIARDAARDAENVRPFDGAVDLTDRAVQPDMTLPFTSVLDENGDLT